MWYIWHKKSLDASDLIGTNEYPWKEKKKSCFDGSYIWDFLRDFQILFFEMGNWSLADNLTWLYFVDNEDL